MSPTRLGLADTGDLQGNPCRAARAFHELDWGTTPLGSQDTWPQVLRTLVDLTLNSGQPMFLVWGPARITIYNDSYADILADRHPAAMGRPLEEIWSDIYDATVAPIVAQAYAGIPVTMDDIEIVTTRRGYLEEAHFSFSYTPVRDGSGRVLGFFCACFETSQAVFEARRAKMMASLNEHLREVDDPRRILRSAIGVIADSVDASAVAFCEYDVDRKDLLVREQWCGAEHLHISPRLGEEDMTDDAIARLENGETVVIERQAASLVGSSLGWARSCLAIPVRPTEGLAAVLLVLDRGDRQWLENKVGLLANAAERTWSFFQKALNERELHASEARFRAMTDALPQLAWSVGPDARKDHFNARWYEFTGAPRNRISREGWIDFVHPNDRDDLLAQRARAWADSTGYEIEVRLWKQDEGYRTMLLRDVPVSDDAMGKVRRLGTATDIHEIRQAQRHRETLTAELHHRVKNTLAIVQAIAQQSFRGAKSHDQMLDDFHDRLSALGKAHDILTSHGWSSASLRDLVEMSLIGCGVRTERITINGPLVVLPPRTAISMTMAIHELCTNAIKYGALSCKGGGVRITWDLAPQVADAPANLVFTWTEHDGPPVVPPAERGFGTRMIERALAAELEGTSDIIFEPDGVVCRIEAEIKSSNDKVRNPET